MNGITGSLGIFFIGGVLCLLTQGRPTLTRWMGQTVALLGALLAIGPVLQALIGSKLPLLVLPWNVPFASFAIELDALSALFALPILIVTVLAAIYGAGYLRAYAEKKDLAFAWCFYNLLAGSMLLVVVARNAWLFLIAWEVMTLASFFLVLFENEKESVRHAAWTYLVATHLGTAFLLVMFVLLGQGSNSFDFDGFTMNAQVGGMASTIFLLALIGFGTKAGFMPMHVWLPEAHPAAPSHVSAVMSGVMIKTGIYGLVRILTFLGPPPAWWGWTLLSVGVVSGILGVTFALAQHDLKRLLAYHSVENIGIIALGLGMGLLGLSYNAPMLAFFGFAGGLLHVINHAIFKSLLFLGAGSVLHATGTRDIEHLGGLLKRMPVTGVTFLIGSIAICGLPPLNGFISEFFLYVASLSAITGPDHSVPLAAVGLIVLGSLALIGGLALACFTKAFGIVFLGEARSEHCASAHESARSLTLPMILLAAACVVIGFSGPLWLTLMRPAVAVMTGTVALPQGALPVENALWAITLIATGLVLLGGILAYTRSRLLAGRTIGETGTWDCGYVAPTARMQYTASSFAAPLTQLFGKVLRTHHRFVPPEGLFPAESSFATETPDLYRERVYGPAFRAAEDFLARFRWLQHGRINFYILFIILALLALLAWKMG